jgi:hypothetical protein
MALQLFPDAPPLAAVTASMSSIVAGGHLIERELISGDTLRSRGGERGVGRPDYETLERLDKAGALCPVAYLPPGMAWMSWRVTDLPYPVEGTWFREEHDFVPWADLFPDSEHDEDEGPRVRPLYSEWQLMYLREAIDGYSVAVPADVMLEGGDRLTTWAANHAGFVTMSMQIWTTRDAAWRPTIKLLTRLQSRYWPMVSGTATLLIDTTTKTEGSNDYVGAIDREYDSHTAESVLAELGIEVDDVVGLYDWLAWRAEHKHPLPDLHQLLRLAPRRRLERHRGAARLALDWLDAAEMIRRFVHELTGELPTDIDQRNDDTATPRPLRRDRSELVEALRASEMYPHRLHLVVEGETEERLVRLLFEAFHGGKWEGSGIEMTDLGGDKLEGARTMLEGFGVYADEVALLLDDENQAKRITQALARDGVVAEQHVHLWDKSLEEDNFTTTELVEMVRDLGREMGAELTLDATTLEAEYARKPGKGLASTLQRLARDPEHGAVVYAKPDLARLMAQNIFDDLRANGGKHQALFERRPIVRWMLRFPVRAARS